jgi:hypothetical protein
MIPGLNEDVKYQGEVFHLQTEDCGRKHPFVRTCLFYKGNVMYAQQESYEALLPVSNLEGRVQRMLQTQHQEIKNRLLAGDFNEQILRSAQRHASAASAADKAGADRRALSYRGGGVSAAVGAEDKDLDQQIDSFLKKKGKPQGSQ